METTFFRSFEFASLCVCRLCTTFRTCVQGYLECLPFTFTSRFVIDFLSVRKVIIFSAIATDDRYGHVL